jgi:hypothetical protein
MTDEPLHKDRRQKEGLARLVVGLALNVGLWFVFPELAKWSTVQKEIRDHLIGGSLAAAVWVFVVPVFWRGIPWQAPIAFVLIFFLPGFAFVSVLMTIFKYL